MDIKLIKTESDYEEALNITADLMESNYLTEEESDRLDILITLIAAYEETHHPIPAPDPISYIEFIMEQRNLSRKDLEPFIGKRGRVAEILNRVRPLTISMMRKLHDGLGIPADILIQKYH
ncbi:MAG: transcriptional regulator [Thermodesulfobacteriota bacterium]|nr:transcriptional regulator [Thermodesulfobacteriota bacterium]